MQACRGKNYDVGQSGSAYRERSCDDTLGHDGPDDDDDDSSDKGEYHLPTHANILIAHAAYEGLLSP